MSTTVDVHFVDCVHEYRTSPGSLTSKNYPGPYDANTDCLYIVKPPSGSLYSLKIDGTKYLNLFLFPVFFSDFIDNHRFTGHLSHNDKGMN